MTLGQCEKVSTVSKIKVEENGRQVIIINPDKETFIVTQVDGCLIKNTIACDWLISKEPTGNLLIELKGVDVKHAVEQISSTVDYLKSKGKSKFAGLIICKKYPRIDTKIQRIQHFMARKHNAPLHILTKNEEFNFENLFSYKGPLKV